MAAGKYHCIKAPKWDMATGTNEYTKMHAVVLHAIPPSGSLESTPVQVSATRLRHTELIFAVCFRTCQYLELPVPLSLTSLSLLC
jgi:hypothetical protein